jgi:hypothetical protein
MFVVATSEKQKGHPGFSTSSRRAEQSTSTAVFVEPFREERSTQVVDLIF